MPERDLPGRSRDQRQAQRQQAASQALVSVCKQIGRRGRKRQREGRGRQRRRRASAARGPPGSAR